MPSGCLFFNLIPTLQVSRVRSVIADGVKEIWLSSEDTGAYGNLKLTCFEIFLFLLDFWLES